MSSPNVPEAGPNGNLNSQFNSYLQQAFASLNNTGAATTQVYDPFGFSTKEAATPVLNGVTHGSTITPGSYVPGMTTNAPDHPDMSTVEDVAKQYASMANSGKDGDKQAWSNTQAQLALIGAYGSTGKYIPGSWTKNDSDALASAFRGYLTSGEQTAQTFSEYLDAQTHAAIDAGKNAGGTTGNGFKATSPQDIALQATNVYQSELGRSIDSTDQSGLISAVQGQQQDAFNQGDVYLRSVTPQAVARQFIIDNNLPEYTQHQAESYLNVFANMFLNGASARAQTSVGDIAVGTTGGSK